MGNCQAIDNATLVIQHPNGRAEKRYFPVAASEIMKMNPGHYVALLLTTTLYSTTAAAAAAAKKDSVAPNNAPLRVTRIKLLRPADILVLGHVYRLVTSQEVMKGLWAKKQAKMQQQKNGNTKEKKGNNQVKQECQRSKNPTQVNSCASKSRAWQPALMSISESGS